MSFTKVAYDKEGEIMMKFIKLTALICCLLPLLGHAVNELEFRAEHIAGYFDRKETVPLKVITQFFEVVAEENITDIQPDFESAKAKMLDKGLNDDLIEKFFENLNSCNVSDKHKQYLLRFVLDYI
jgi:hypothetical protein